MRSILEKGGAFAYSVFRARPRWPASRSACDLPLLHHVVMLDGDMQAAPLCGSARRDEASKARGWQRGSASARLSAQIVCELRVWSVSARC
jgi:hypothetical protein